MVHNIAQICDSFDGTQADLTLFRPAPRNLHQGSSVYYHSYGDKIRSSLDTRVFRVLEFRGDRFTDHDMATYGPAYWLSGDGEGEP